MVIFNGPSLRMHIQALFLLYLEGVVELSCQSAVDGNRLIH